MSSRTCIISLATNDKHYPEALERLQESLARVGFTGRVIFWRPGSFPAESPSHRDVPFAFKPHCFEEVRRLGMDLVFWIDAASVVTRSLDGVFEEIRDRGHLLFNNNRRVVGEYSSDEALSQLGLTRDEALRMPEINAAAIGLNMANPVALEFLSRWRQAAVQEVPFRGSRQPILDGDDYDAMKWNRQGRASNDPRVRGHRHDQTVAGVLAHRLGMGLTPHGIQSYSRQHRRISHRSLIVIDRDVVTPALPVTPLERIVSDARYGRVRRVFDFVDRYVGSRLLRLLPHLDRS